MEVQFKLQVRDFVEWDVQRYHRPQKATVVDLYPSPPTASSRLRAAYERWLRVLQYCQLIIPHVILGVLRHGSSPRQPRLGWYDHRLYRQEVYLEKQDGHSLVDNCPDCLRDRDCDKVRLRILAAPIQESFCPKPTSRHIATAAWEQSTIFRAHAYVFKASDERLTARLRNLAAPHPGVFLPNTNIATAAWEQSTIFRAHAYVFKASDERLT
ncbi:hypothetical protein Bbelb_074960 [Branchiostoma belcheri]|nr:hypothetical protein Bbelb_074960 [Branchiostoma belcheri]